MREQDMIGGYRLLKRLGAGGAATVWLACDEAGERVALKILHPALAADEDYRERLLREARTVNSIRGGGVAHILDIEIDATQPFVVSEYIPGPTLSELLARGALNIGGVAAIGGALAQTLEDVHARRIIHRDVKASNVICSPRGPVLIDFGIA
ncbi:MAG: serine/threonine protein kinase, partial [Trueperella pyogenes]|nr:serine/threonine protein kinase [Trueperella pyogenes]